MKATQNIRNKKKKKDSGSAMLTAMGMVFLVGATTSSLYYQGIFQAKFNDRFIAETRAMELAASGIEVSRYALRHSAADCFLGEMETDSNRILFNNIKMDDSGAYTVQVIPVAGDPYTVKVSSRGTYLPTGTTALIEEKIACGFTDAVDNYAMLVDGNLTISGQLSFEQSSSHVYDNIHANGMLSIGDTEDLPDSISVTHAGASGSLDGKTLTPGDAVSMPTVSAANFFNSFPVIFPQFAGGKFVFGSGGKVLDASGSDVATGGSTVTFGGFTYVPAPNASTAASWQYNGATAAAPENSMLVFNTPVNFTQAFGSELNPQKKLIVAEGDVQATQPIHLARPDGLATKPAGGIALLTGGNISTTSDISIENAALVAKGDVTVANTLTLKNSSLITTGSATLNNVTIAAPPYAGYPVVHNPETPVAQQGKDEIRDIKGFASGTFDANAANIPVSTITPVAMPTYDYNGATNKLVVPEPTPAPTPAPTPTPLPTRTTTRS